MLPELSSATYSMPLYDLIPRMEPYCQGHERTLPVHLGCSTYLEHLHCTRKIDKLSANMTLSGVYGSPLHSSCPKVTQK